MTSAAFPASRSHPRPDRNPAAYSLLARAAIAVAVCAALSPAYGQVGANTLPTGPRVNAGAASVGTVGNKMTVTQTTPKVSLGWESFSIGSKASVVFAQPSSSSVALNRVLGTDVSYIFGSLSANGKVFLINPAGVVFAPGARINVGGIVASTLDMSDQDFLAGRYVFSGNSGASVVNQGAIITSPGGYAALIGADVANEGTISAPGGSVALAAGSRVTMDLAGDGLLSISVDAAAVRAMASNTGLIQAEGGRVIVSARAADALAGTVLNQAGIIEAKSASMRNGEIVLDGGNNGIVAVSGKLDVSGAQDGATGGKVTVTGNLVGLYGADINASGDAGGGTILIGGDYQGKNPDVQNAFRTYVDSGSVLNADAITKGNGGKVIVWADDVTRYYGSISARGGALGGDGGFAEVSGKESLIYHGIADLRAPQGKVGTLLLDPKDIVIETNATSDPGDSASNAFTVNPTGTSSIDPGELETQLNSANVHLQANNDITVSNSVDASNNGNSFGLTLEAGKSINIDANVSLNGFFTATANTVNPNVVEAERAAGSGAFTMSDGTSIDTSAANGNIQISVQTGDPAGVNFDSGSITLSNLAAGAGDVYINQGGATAGSHILRTTSSLITAASVALEISNGTNTGGTIGSAVTGPIRVATTNLDARTQNGAVFLESAGPVNIGGAAFGGGFTGISAGTGNVSLISDDAITQTEAVTGNTLTVKTLNNTAAAATISLNMATNEFATVDLRARNAADNANSSNDISYRDATGFDVAAAHSASNVTLVGGGAITDGASGTLTGSALTVRTESVAGAAITLDNAGHEFGSVDLQSRNVGNTLNTAGAITYVDATGFSAAARSASTVSMTATTGDLSVGANDIITDSGAVTLTALGTNANIISAAGSDIVTTNGPTAGAAVTLRSDNLQLAGLVTAGTGLVTLTPNADSVAIQVGAGAVDGPGVLGITDVELDTITTTGGVTIGSATNTGGITVVGVADQATAPTITGGTFLLRSGTGNIAVNAALSNAVDTTLQTTGGNIIFGAAGAVTASGLTVNLTATGGNIQGNAAALTNVTAGTLNASASSGIGATNAIETAVSTLSFTNTTNAVQITDALAGGVTVSGTNAGTGAVNITETLGNLTVGAADIVTNSGIVTLTNAAVGMGIISAAGSDISTIGGATVGAAVSLFANNMNLAGATNSGTATTTLRQFTNNVTIALGGADVASATLGLTAAEIDTITAGKIKIGDSNSGAMTISGATPIAPVGTSLLSLESGTTITQTTNTATITETNLALRAGTGINLTANNSVIAGEGNSVTNLAAVTTGTGAISFRNNATMTVGVVDGVDGISTNDGAISVTVAGSSAGATNLLVDKVAAGNAGTVTLVASNAGAGQANIFEAPLGGGTGDSPDFDITTTGALSLTAKNDIGQPSGTAAGPIEIAVGSLAFSTGPGFTAYLLQTGDIDLTTMTTQGDVSFEALGTITVTGDLNVNGNTTLTSTGDGEDIIVLANINRTNDSAGFVTLKAQRHVILDNMADITALNATPGGDGKTIVTLNSDSNALNGGAIQINAGSTITSNNGPVILGGGLNPLTAAAIGTDFNGSTLFNGIDLQGAIVAGTGNVSLRGQSFFGGGQSGVAGVTINNGGSITTGADDGSHTLAGISITGIGDRGTGSTQGVLIDGGSLLTTSGTINVSGSHVNNVSGGSNVGVLVRNGASITSTETAATASAVTLTGTGGAGLGDADHGLVVNGATLTVSGANLNLGGTGGGGGAAGGANSAGIQIANAGIVQTTGTGVLTLAGTGGATDGGLNYGIEIKDLGTQLRATATGSTLLRINLDGDGGAGGATGADNYGILVRDSAQVTANNSHIAFNGTGGASGGGANFGIAVLNGGVVESLRTVVGAGNIAFTGTGGAGTGNNDTGIVVSGTNSRVTTHFGSISFTGTGGADTTGGSNHGILVASDAAVETDGEGQINLSGTGSLTANGGNNFGVFIDSNGVVRNTQSADLVGTAGKITVTGVGGLGTGAGDGGIGLQGGGTVSTVNAEIQLAGTGGAGTVGGQSYGVYSDGGIVSTSGDGNILITGTGGAAAGGSNYGIYTLGAAQIESLATNAVNPAGTITLAGTAGVGGNDDIGINVTGGTTVTSVDGKIDFFGIGTGTGTGSHGVRLATDASIASTGLALIEIDGFGATLGTGNAVGILLDTGAAITSTSTSTITLTGTGGGASGSGNDNYGIQVNGTGTLDTRITSVTGNILLTGTGGGQLASTGNAGIKVSDQADISTTGAATVNLVGLSGITNGTNNYGVWITGTDTTVESTPTATATGDLNITGTGRGTGTFAVGVVVDSNALVTTTGAGDVTILGQGSTTGSGSAYGIQVNSGAGITSNTGAGRITLTGTGGGTAGSGNDNWGILVNGTGTLDTRITSVTGDVLLTGTGGGQTTSTGNAGIKVSGEADIATSGAAKVDLVGLSGITTGTNNYGVWITGGDTTVHSTSSAAATGDLNITGTGRGTGLNAFGVLVDGTAQVLTQGAGDVTITGTGSTTGTGSAFGIHTNNASVVSNTGTGLITLAGTGGGTAGSGNTNYGVNLQNNTQVTSVTGNIALNGTGGGNGAAADNVGVVVGGGSDVITTGNAAISITGLSGITSGVSNFGVQVTGLNTTVSSSGTATSDITINGTGRGTGTDAFGVLVHAAALVQTTGAGDIAITGTGSTTGTGSAVGVQVDNASVVSNTGAGLITLDGTGGGTAGSGNNNYGVNLLTNAQVTSVTGNILIDGTGGGTGASTGNIGVLVQSGSDVITSGAAKLDIIGQSGITSGVDNFGVQVTGGGTTVHSTSTATATGDINITGTGRGTGTGAFGVLVDGTAQVLTQGAGDVTITGTGSTTGTGSAVGVQVDNASVVSNTGAGLITLDGTGGGTAGSGNNNYGVNLLTNAQVTSVTGNILIDGTGGGTGASTGNIGVLVQSGSDVITSGAAKLDIIGQSGITSGVDNFGVQVTGGGTTVHSTSTATATGDINITGTGRGTGTGAFGVLVDGTAQVLTQGAGDVTITGTGSTTGTGSAAGVQVDNASVVSNTGAGLITLDGTGGGTAGSGNDNFGVVLSTAAQVTTVTGDVLIDGTGGGTGAATGNIGVLVQSGSDVITSGAAKLDIIGQSGITSGVDNFGVQVTGGGTTVHSTSTATATGDINITGTGRGTGTGAFGVLVDGTAQVLTQGAGDVTITGTGSTTGTGSAAGVQVDNASVVSNTGAGMITLAGTGGGTTGSGDQNTGVRLVNTAQVNSVTGNIAMSGTGGGTGASIGNIGVQVASGSDIASTGAATTTITGTGGNTSGTGNHGVQVTAGGTTVTSTSSAIFLNGTGGGTGGDSVGVLVDSGALVGTATGSATLTGTGAATGANNFGVSLAGGTVESTSSGSLALIGTGGGGAADISAAGGGNTIGNGGMTGEILLRSLGSVGTVSDATILTSGSAGIVTLNAEGGGGFNQTGGTLVSDSLRFLGSGTFTLLQPGNAVNEMAGTLAATSTVDYSQAGALQIASLTSFQDGVGINQTTSNGLNIAGAASVLNLTTGGITQSGTAPIVVPGTTTLTDGANDIVLNNQGNSFGTVNVPSANDVTLGGTSIGLGDVTPSGDLTINADTLTDSGTVIVPGLATFNVDGDMVLDSPASDFSSVTFNVGGNASLTDVNELVVNTSFVDGLLTLITGGALTSNGLVSAGAVDFTVTSGGVGTLASPFTLNTDGDITLTITGTVAGSPAAGFVTNAGSGLLNLLPPTGLVQFQIVEFQPPTPAFAALFVSKQYPDVPLEEVTDVIYVTDDPAEQEYPGVRGRIGRLANGAEIRDGGIRMPPGLASGGGQPAPDAGIEPVRGSRFLLRN